MYELARDARQFLEQIHPLAPWLSLAGAAWLFVFLVRRHAPELWLWLEKQGPKKAPASRVFLALPSVIIGAGLSGLASNTDPYQTVMGAVVGATAPVWHHFLKSLPQLPYRGEVKEDK